MRMWPILLLFAVYCAAPVQASVLSPAGDGDIIDGLKFGGGLQPKDGVPDQIDTAQSVQLLNDTLVEYQGIIEFNISGFSAPLTSAYLKLPVIDQLGANQHLKLYGYEGNGALDNSDFNSGTLITPFTVSGEHEFVFDVTPFLQSVKTDGAGFAGFDLRKTDIDPAASGVPFVAFGSLEQPSEAQLFLNESRPVTAPEPAGTVLFLLGALLLAAARLCKTPFLNKHS